MIQELQNFRTPELPQMKNYINDPQDLEVFKLAYKTSLEVVKISSELPKHEQYDLASQMRRSSRSICSNICEGFYKQGDYPAEFKRFLTISIGSCGEIKLWLRYCVDLGYIDAQISKKMIEDYGQIKKMLGALRGK